VDEIRQHEESLQMFLEDGEGEEERGRVGERKISLLLISLSQVVYHFNAQPPFVGKRRAYT